MPPKGGNAALTTKDIQDVIALRAHAEVDGRTEVTVKRRPAGWLLAAAIVSLPTACAAYFLDADETVQLLGRVYSQTALRTESSSGFTFPRHPSATWCSNGTSWRSSSRTSLDRWLPGRPVWLNDLGYRLRFKGVYEGLYDYGPQEYSNQVEVNPPSPFDPHEPAIETHCQPRPHNRQILGHQDESVECLRAGKHRAALLAHRPPGSLLGRDRRLPSSRHDRAARQPLWPAARRRPRRSADPAVDDARHAGAAVAKRERHQPHPRLLFRSRADRRSGGADRAARQSLRRCRPRRASLLAR